ncbi:hypothetical protein [Paenibacillus sp. PAMC21692]|uniref:hypothetical protein n=1 Tax=Paenibacillus sp. PAMC21692 TaxID=2762320 RepID=UPI00164DE740|nr:hypothetical protein [Paenibacillus sp. PAMC21692]QNK55647.1 hypothetical protein H7F31_24020 [Paenibacillus sp. PAMC21692]
MIRSKEGRELYLDTMQLAWDGYGQARIEQRLTADGNGRMDLHSYSRMLTVLSCLIHGGRKRDAAALWEEMMVGCCKEIADSEGNHEADFAMKEIMFSALIVKDVLSEWETIRTRWAPLLERAEPYRTFVSVWREGEDPSHLHNINVYNMVGEYMREREGLTDSGAYFARHWPEQLTRFDGNGMYRDPGNPILYDITTRAHIALLLGFGYDGPFASELDERLRQAGPLTLFMQSAAGEFAYGGRSNGFLFNESLLAAIAEYEAVRYKREGNDVLAGAFKRSARMAAESIAPWLGMEQPRHLKNKFPVASKHGTEGYGYYDKYMITMGAFLAIGYWLCDDSIAESPCPAETGGYVWETSESFHKVFAGAGGYSVEVDTSADLHYDATGLGRIHRSSLPSELALSSPLTDHEAYALSPGFERISATIGPGWPRQDGSVRYLSACTGLQAEVTIVAATPELAEFTIRYCGDELGDCGGIKETYRISAAGVELDMELEDPGAAEIAVRVPLLVTNGLEETERLLSPDRIQVLLGDAVYECKISGDGSLAISEMVYGNRNGAYAMAEWTLPGNKASLLLTLNKRALNTASTWKG